MTTNSALDNTDSIHAYSGKKNILLVCNNPEDCQILLNQLSNESYEIKVVTKAREAIDSLNTGYFDSVVIEPSLPDMDGWKLSRLIRSDILSIDKNIPIIVASKTYSQRITESIAREFEVNAFVNLKRVSVLPRVLSEAIEEKNDKYRPRMLVIEDASDTVKLIQRFLDNRYEIEIRNDGSSGLAAWKESQYDIVLLDIMLPEMSGATVLEAIHKTKPDQSVVVMTAHCDQEMACELMLAGATDFISKPFKASQLRRVCDIALHREDYLISQQQVDSGVVELKNSESKYRRLVESLSDEHFIYTQLPDGSFSYVSPSIENMLGYPVDDFLDNYEAYVTANPKNEDSRKFHHACLKGEMQPKFEMELIRKDGSLCQLEIMETPEIVEKEVIAVHGIAHDVTSRVEKTNLLKTLAYATFEGVLVHEQGMIIEMNHTVEQMFDVGRHGLIGSDIRLLIAEEQRDIAINLLNTNKEMSIETVGVRSNMDRFPLLIRMKKVQFNNREIDVIALEDLTEKRQAEEEKELIQKQLRQTQKMESIGHLTGGIAHDFNNILASIQGYTSLSLEMFGPQDDKLGQYLSEIAKASERARVLISQMLAFSRGGTAEPKPLELVQHIKDAIKMLRSTMPSSIVIRENLPDGLPTAMADAVQFHQIIMNICINARDAIESGEGVIDITLEHQKLKKQVCSSCHKYIEGEFLVVRVRDTGKGIGEETLSNIFDPFFTTKPVDKGTGMGLSVVHGIMHDHKGHVVVNSRIGEGTEFQLMFPASDGMVEVKEEKAAINLSTGRGHIMVVDDDNDLAGFLREMLTQRGYEVELFVDPCKALVEFETSPGKYDLVLTDQTMPILPGHKLAKAMLKKRPDIPIILCTGYSDVMSEEKSREMNISGFLQKPVESNQLVKMINNLIVNGVGETGTTVH